MKKFILTGLTAALMSANVMASEVVEGTDTTVFTADSPAVASEVNGNFAALIAAINDNSQRLDALEDIVGDGSVAGSYTFIEMAVELAADSGTELTQGYSEISTYNSSGSFTLDAQGDFSGTINDNRSTLFDTQNGNCEVEGCRDVFDPDFNNPGSESLGGTLTDNGSTVTLSFGGDGIVFHKAGPNLLVYSGKEIETGSQPIFDFTNIVMLVKQ